MAKDSEVLLPEGGSGGRRDPLSFNEETPEGQRRAVTAGGRLITVGAGAGTGKTWVLSNRYARLLLSSQELLPRDILTLTYTEAAASEMRSRIEKRVRDLLSQTSPDNKRKEAILGGFSEAWISTIHSFAARLIRESGLALDLDPRAAVISAPQEERFWDSIREAVEFANLSALAGAYGGFRGAQQPPELQYGDADLQEAAAALDADPLLSAAIGRWGAVRLSALARDAAELHASLGHRWEQMMAWGTGGGEGLFQAAREPVAAILNGAWRRAWAAWGEVFSALGDDIQAKGQKDREAGKATSADALLLDCLERWGEALSTEPDEESLRAFYLHVTDKAKLRGGNTKLLKEVRGLLGTTLGVWQDGEAGLAAVSAALDAPVPEPERQLHNLLLRFCATAWGLWDTMKRRRGLLSFSDMILHAREALGTGGLNRSFRHILVDEFQDTDPLQFDMIRSLAGDGGPTGSGLTSLFAVGDPKQSIYGFRHAEPSLFAETIGRAETKVELNVSFRTRSSLLERINDLFAHIWREGLGASGALSRLKFEPLSPAPVEAERNKGTLPPFSVLLSVKGGRPLDETREQLARELGRKIASWVSGGLTVWDKEEQALRPVRYGDFAVLVRGRGTHDLLERALAAEGVPAVQDLSRGYFARGEVEDVICLLRAAADPEDDAAVAGWLLSPFSGVPEAEAMSLLERVNSQQRPIEVLRASLPDSFATLQRLSLIGEQRGPAGLLSLLDRDRRWLAYYKEEERLRVLRNVRRALSIARGFQRDGASSLATCADWMAHALRQGVVMDEPTWHGKNVDAVLLSTIHSSKGLEYPVVAIFDTVARGRKSAAQEGLRPSKTLGVVFSALPDEMTGSETEATGSLQGAAWDKLLAAQGELEEDMRLLYVAATRARDGLLVCGLLGEKDGLLTPQKGSWTSLFLERMTARGECPSMEGGVPPESLAVPNITLVPSDSLPEKNERKRAAPSPAPRRVPLPGLEGVRLSQLSATSFAMFEWCPLAWRRRYRQGLDLRWESPDRDLLSEEGRGGAELGSLAHWLLARWPSLEGGDEEAELDTWLADERVIHRLPSYLRDVWRDEKNREELGKWLRCFAHSEAGKDVREALALGAVREAGFRVDLRGGVPPGVTLAGAMDLVWREGDSGLWRVMDYKITLSRKAPPGLYGAQLDFYALAVREAALREGLPCEAVDVGLVFLREDSRVERRRLGEADWDGLRARVLDTARHGAAGDFSPQTSHCSSCPWKTGCPAFISGLAEP